MLKVGFFVERVKKYKSFSDIFSYLGIKNGVLYLDNPKRVTIVLEIFLSEYNSTEVLQYRHDKLMKILCTFPPDIRISLYNCKSFFSAVPKLIQNANSPDIVKYMEKNKYDMVLSRKSPEFSTFLTLTLPVILDKETVFHKANRKHNERKDKQQQEEQIGFSDREIAQFKMVRERLLLCLKVLKSGVDDGYIEMLDDSRVFAFFSKILNHQYVGEVNNFSEVLKSDWLSCVSGILGNNRGYIYYNGNYHAILSVRANTIDSHVPSMTDASMNAVFKHGDIWDIPFIVHHSIRVPEKGVGLRRARQRLSMISTREGFAKYIKIFERTPEGLPPEKLRQIVEAAIASVEESSDMKFVEQFFHVHLWNETLSGLEKMYKTFDATVSMTYKMRREKYNIKGAYFSLLPGNEDLETITTTLPSFNTADFLPIDLPRWPFFAYKNKWELYYHNEMDSFAKIDLFDVRSDNHNAIVAGGSGSGKSFTEQDKLWQAMKYDPCVAIIDFGGEGMGSYMSFVKNMKGTYLEISLNTKFSINPFEGYYYVVRTSKIIKDEFGEEKELIEERAAEVFVGENGKKCVEKGGIPDGMRHTALMATLNNMIQGRKMEAIPATVYANLTSCVRLYYLDTDNNKNNVCNLSDFALKYLRDNPLFLNEPGWDLYKSLIEFIGEGAEQGAYASFFRTTQEIANKDVVCFDMAGLASHERLKAVLVPALINNIMTNILGDIKKRDRRKLIIMDEAWRELQGGDMAGFMMEMFRTVRKLNGQITIITQSIDDLLGSSSANALMSNTSYYYLIGNKHNPESLKHLKAGTTVLTDYDIEVITTQKSKRDFFLLTPFFAGQLRFYPTREFTMLASTHPDHRILIDKYRRKFDVDYTSPEVIEALKQDEHFVI